MKSTFAVFLFVVTSKRVICDDHFRNRFSPPLFLPPGYTTTERLYADPLKQQIFYNPNNGYQAYWADGEWHIRNPWDWDKSNISTTRVPTVCGDECPYLYTSVGKVCARSVQQTHTGNCDNKLCGHHESGQVNIHLEYTTIPTYCKFLDLKCKEKRSMYKLAFVHIGACFKKEYHAKLYPPNTHIYNIFSRLKTYLDDYNQNHSTLQYLLSNFTTPRKK